MNTPYVCQSSTPYDIEAHYHDTEWGVPITNEAKHFETLILQGTKSGLSWHTVLSKRENYRQAFAQFNPQRVAQYTEQNIQELLENKGIVRNRLKIQAAIHNAKCFLDVQREFGSFNEYIWSFVDFCPIDNGWETEDDIPKSTPLSDTISDDLKNRGFKFVGTTTVYAYMQAIGMVNDHVTISTRYREIQSLQETFKQSMREDLAC